MHDTMRTVQVVYASRVANRNIGNIEPLEPLVEKGYIEQMFNPSSL